MNLLPTSLSATLPSLGASGGTAASRLGLGLTLLLLAGCATQSQSVGVTSPPPPLIGSAPIAAYDDYARGVAPPLKVRVESVAQNTVP